MINSTLPTTLESVILIVSIAGAFFADNFDQDKDTTGIVSFFNMNLLRLSELDVLKIYNVIFTKYNGKLAPFWPEFDPMRFQ